MDNSLAYIAELKLELKRKGAKITGTKEKLIERLNDYDTNYNFKPNPNYSNLQSDMQYSIVWPEENTYNSVDSKIVTPNLDIINTYFLELFKDGIVKNQKLFASMPVLCYALLKFKEQNTWFIKQTPMEKKQIWHTPKKIRLHNYAISEYHECKKRREAYAMTQDQRLHVIIKLNVKCPFSIK